MPTTKRKKARPAGAKRTKPTGRTASVSRKTKSSRTRAATTTRKARPARKSVKISVSQTTVRRKIVVLRPPRVPELTDRMTIRTRPDGPAMLHQTWDKLLFLHWRAPVEELRALIPPPLSIDTYNGSAWIGITPFTITDSHPSFTPPLPWISAFHEVNVRTYVHLDGVPGVWFFSLDANSAVAVLGARAFFRLPYFQADIVHEVEGKRIHCRSSRKDSHPPAEITATWSPSAEVRRAEPGSLEFFWVERYCLYTADEEKIYRARVFHEPWPIRDVILANYETSLLDADGLPVSDEKDKARLLAAGPVEVDIWPIEEVATF